MLSRGRPSSSASDILRAGRDHQALTLEGEGTSLTSIKPSPLPPLKQPLLRRSDRRDPFWWMERLA